MEFGIGHFLGPGGLSVDNGGSDYGREIIREARTWLSGLPGLYSDMISKRALNWSADSYQIGVLGPLRRTGPTRWKGPTIPDQCRIKQISSAWAAEDLFNALSNNLQLTIVVQISRYGPAVPNREPDFSAFYDCFSFIYKSGIIVPNRVMK